MYERVLLAENASFMRRIQKDALEKHGFEVCGEIADGLDVAGRYKELEPDVLILGLMLPKMDGIEILKLIKNHYPEAKIIICSSMSYETIVADALKYGACNFIVKPFEVEFFVNAVKAAITTTNHTEMLNPYTVKGWYADQTNHEPAEHLPQEQINTIVDSFYQLYT